jgi:hypothetical protein
MVGDMVDDNHTDIQSYRTLDAFVFIYFHHTDSPPQNDEKRVANALSQTNLNTW